MSNNNEQIKPAHQIGRAFFYADHSVNVPRGRGDRGPLTPAERHMEHEEHRITRQIAQAYDHFCRPGCR